MCAWTYSGNPNASRVDAVHYFLGDTDPGNPVSTDEECAFELCNYGMNPLLAAASIAETKAAQFVMRPTRVRRGDRITDYGDGAQAYRMLAQSLRLKASIASTVIYSGGVDVAEKQAERADMSTVKPFATTDLHTPRPWRGWEEEERQP